MRLLTLTVTLTLTLTLTLILTLTLPPTLTRCVQLLVEAGANTAAEYGKNGDTALSLAQKYRFEPCPV